MGPNVSAVFPQVHHPAGSADELALAVELAEQPTADTHPQRAGRDDAVALPLVEELVARGFLQRFVSLAECQEYLGAPPVVSPFLVVTKTRHGQTKHRLVLDLKRSGVSALTRATHRVILPRATGAVTDVLDSLATRGGG